MRQLSTHHSYEELRGVVVDVLLKRESIRQAPTHYQYLVSGVAEVLARRGSPATNMPHISGSDEVRLDARDVDLIRDVFWDMFRQGYVVLGGHDPNEPFRLSQFAEQTLKSHSPYRFHDTSSFIAMVTKEVQDISSETIAYLEEAVAAFYADCLLSSCVMVGVAAEIEFLRLLDVASKSTAYGSAFPLGPKHDPIRKKITKFQKSLQPLLNAKSLPQEAVEDLDTNFSHIQSVLRISRNDAGHAKTTKLQRELVYVNLQLFVPFARQLMKLRAALA